MTQEPTSTVLFWNIWGHRVPQGIHEYIAAHQEQIDVCCLTEVTSMKRPYEPIPQVHANTENYEPPSFINGREQLSAEFGSRFDIEYAAPNFGPMICKVTEKTYEDVGFGSALLIRKGLRTIETGSKPILLHTEGVQPRVLQHVAYERFGMRYLIVHLHGVWLRHNTKGDDPIRLRQSWETLAYIDRVALDHAIDRIIFGGDLNLDMGTDALGQIELGFGTPWRFRNMIREMKIEGTRTPVYRKFDMPGESRFADYVFVTPKVHVHDLDVNTGVTASDHAPLLLTFS